MSFTNITNVGIQHSDALRGLDFYTEEIKIIMLRLSEIASKNTSFEARQGIEHFQNQFDIQQKNIHDLRHKLKEHTHIMSIQALQHAGRVGEDKKEEEKKILTEYTTLEKVINELRHEFNNYMSKWL